MDHVRLAVLRSGARDGPNLLFKIELIPGHLGDFLPALRKQAPTSGVGPDGGLENEPRKNRAGRQATGILKTL